MNAISKDATKFAPTKGSPHEKQWMASNDLKIISMTKAAIKFAPVKGSPPQVRWMACKDLLIDTEYQRLVTGKQSQRLILIIAESWDWRLLSPLTVSLRDGSYGPAGYYVIDGQHRLEAAKMRGDIPMLPCIVSPFVSYEEEALAFVNINSARRQVTALDRYHARVAAKEPLALKIKETAELVGLTVTRHNDAEMWGVDEISFPDDIGRAIERDGKMHGATETALGLLVGWAGKTLYQGKELFAGLLIVAGSQWPEDADRFYQEFVDHLGSKRQTLWIAERNRIMADNEGMSASHAMAQAFVRTFPGDGTKLGRPRGTGQKRHDKKPVGHGISLAPDHKAMTAGETRFPHTLRDPNQETYVLKSGHNNSKIGSEVEVGPWKGMPIMTLTLEERATCPTNCKVLDACYGNNMHWAQRFRHGPALEKKIYEQLEDLQAGHPQGFVVRLHVLGDFYSLDYVLFWERMLAKFPALHVYGYTANDPSDPIGEKLLSIAVDQWERFAMRFSGQDTMSELAAIIITKQEDCPENAFVCLAQIDKAPCCASCGACWGSEKNVAFLKH